MISSTNIEIAIIGHDKNKMPQLKHELFKPIILSDLIYPKAIYSSNSLSESRFFLGQNIFSDNAHVVGCLTSSWDIKYMPNKLNNILRWPQANFLHIMKKNTNIVLCASLCYGKSAKPNAPLWETDFQKHFRNHCKNTEWIQKGIYKITGLEYNNGAIAPYSNQIICNRSLFNELCFFIREIIDDIISYFGLNPPLDGKHIDQNRKLGYIMEEISMLWWSKKENIKYIPCGRIIHGWYK